MSAESLLNDYIQAKALLRGIIDSGIKTKQELLSALEIDLDKPLKKGG